MSMTSVCSSSPSSYDHALNSDSFIATSPKRHSHHHQISDSAAALPKAQGDKPTSPLHLPRGHDSTDVAAFSKSLEENATMSSLIATQEQKRQSKASATHNLNEGISMIEDEVDEGPQGPFEGPEKLLELWFADSQDDVEGEGLRGVSKAVWEDMLEIVKCKVLSTIKSNDVDAYLLSESSMFIFPHKLILKTCGTTTLLLGLERILEIAHDALSIVSTKGDISTGYLGKLVKQCFYSRKSFMFPERQKGPHKDWLLEVNLLDHFFEKGSAYTVGKMNGDHWLLYMTSASPVQQCDEPTMEIERPLQLPASAGHRGFSDQTLEILMTHLSSESCSRFIFPGESYGIDDATNSDRGYLLGSQISNQLGLSTLFPKTTIDAFAFEPCGYSANAIIGRSEREGGDAKMEDAYWTVHVTPEEDCSYASFETNVHMDESGQVNSKDLSWLIAQVLRIFEPSRLSVTLFASSRNDSQVVMADARKQQDQFRKKTQCEVLRALQLANYTRTDRIAYEFEDYDLVFVSFDKKGMTLPRR